MTLPRFFGHGGKVSLHIGTLSGRLGALRALRERLIARAGHAPAVDEYLERRTGDSLEAFVRDGYLAAQYATLDRIAALRERLGAVYERVGRGESAPDVAEVRGMLDDMARALDELVSPSEQARRASPVLASDSAQPVSTPVPASLPPHDLLVDPARGALHEQTASLPPEQRALVERATAMDPEGARHVVSAEDVPVREQRLAELARTLRRAGIMAADVMAVEAALREAWARRTEATRAASGLDAQRQAAARVLLARAADPALEAAVHGAPSFFQRWAYEAPDTLLALWRLYTQSGSQGTFRAYVENIIARRHYRGMLGEYQAAFLLGSDYILLKAPDQNVTIPGTDIVAVHRRTGEVLLLDNKALQDALVSKVPALLENLPANLLDDVRSFGDQIGLRPEHDLPVNGAVNRLDMALGAIRAYLAANPGADLDSAAVQRRIGDLLAAQNIRRGVTGEGGSATGVTQPLTERRIDFIPLKANGGN